MNARRWFRNCILIILAVLALCGLLVVYLDPFFHYHMPLKDFYYVLDEQRSQNNGITKRFDYDAIITGTSMTENFKTSEFDALFGARSIKVPYAGATFKEQNDNLEVAFQTHDDIRFVLRGLDLSMIAQDPGAMRDDMGTYPAYLYNRNPFDDVKYLFNRDVILRYCGMMIFHRLRGVRGGVTTFDAYSYTGDNFNYDVMSALEGDTTFLDPEEIIPLTQKERQNAVTNIEAYVCALARAHPETTFYYFVPPYSMAYWGKDKEAGTLDRSLELHRMLIEEMVKVENIHVFGFGTMTEITADLNNYHDRGHYGPWINTLILEEMCEGKRRITPENADAYLTEFEALVRGYDYDSLLPSEPD